MKGFVETPQHVVDLMVEMLFRDRPPTHQSKVLDPGSGTGVFIEGILRWYGSSKGAMPKILGVESDARHERRTDPKLLKHPSIRMIHRDFLAWDGGLFDYIIGNPPYVPITALTENEKRRYRMRFLTATGRFDLYLLFFEQALKMLEPGGRLVFITPEKYLYVDTAAPLRQLLATKQVEEIQMLSEDAFGSLVTYPTVTVVTNTSGPSETKVTLRDHRSMKVKFPQDGSSWLPSVFGLNTRKRSPTLMDACTRISCGVATGADSVFVRRTREIERPLCSFAYPTISGRELQPGSLDLQSSYSMLIPYDRRGGLLPEGELHHLHEYLSRPDRRLRLEARTCVSRKPWYAFHETPPLPDLLRPKLLCKDITALPEVWIDRTGDIVPRHSVYYLVPKDASRIEEIADYLRSSTVRRWLRANCQRAANGFLRMQSTVLKRIPIPADLVAGPVQETFPGIDASDDAGGSAAAG